MFDHIVPVIKYSLNCFMQFGQNFCKLTCLNITSCFFTVIMVVAAQGFPSAGATPQ